MLRFFALVLFFAVANGSAQTPAQNVPMQTPATQAAEPSISSEVQEAEAALAKSDWKTAQAKLNLWLASHPSDGRALFDAGYAADELDEKDQAVELYRRAVTANPRSFEAQLSLGLLLARQGKLEEAHTALAAATSLDPGQAGPEAKAHAWRALARIDQPTDDRPGDAAAASSELLEALRLTPETIEDTLLAAVLAEDTDQYEAAESAYKRILAKDPKSAAANAGLAHLLISRKQYSEAETMLRAALAATPNDPALTAQLATVLVAENKAEALPLLQKLHDTHPGDEAVTRMLAAVLAEAGDATGSDHYYTTLLAAHPNDADLLIAHGQNLLEIMHDADAYLVFTKATELDPANPDGWSGLAFAASRTHHPEVTLHALTMRSQYLPEIASTYFLWATAYDTLNNRASAKVYYHHFLESAAGKFPEQEAQARQRLLVLNK